MATAHSAARSLRLYSVVPLTRSVPLTMSLHTPGSTLACGARRGKHRLIYDFPALMHPPAPDASSYVHGASSIPLLGLTIGEALNEAAARFADRDPVVACHQGIRLT